MEARKLIYLILMISLISCSNIEKKETEISELSNKSHISIDECIKLKTYCKNNGFNSNICILVDFSEYSGNERLYIYNLNRNYIEESGRVAHGIGRKGLFSKVSFSNVPESWESSLGKYKIGKLRTLNIPQFKNIPCLEVYGLDTTNSNAYRRGIVIHPGLLTSRKTVTPCEPLSQGCFTVGQTTFESIVSLVKKSDKPILLYAYQ